MKVVSFAGGAFPFVAPADDGYLSSMPPEGPVDVIPIFDAFCEPGNVVIDVGANIGITAVLAGAMVKGGRVIAVEPVTETFSFLVRNVRASGLSNVECIRAAAAASDAGELALVTRPSANVAAFVGSTDTMERYAGYSEVIAPAMTLDAIVAEHGVESVDFVKIDVEGYELEVLKGAEDLLRRFEPVVFLEVNHYCLNVFRRVSIVDFVDEVLSKFETVFAIDASFEVMDLTDRATHHVFFHENVVRGRFANLICGPAARVTGPLERLRQGAADLADPAGGSDEVETDSGPPSAVPGSWALRARKLLHRL